MDVAVAHQSCGLAAPVSPGPLSPPHSDTGEPVLHQAGPADKPMDLSSGGGLTTAALLCGAVKSGSGQGGIMASSDTGPLALVHAQRRLADLVRQQHQESDQRERGESKRKWDDEDEQADDGGQAAVRRHSGHSDWSSDRVGGPGSPAGSTGSSDSAQSSAAGQHREEKRRRLDMLLNKKFDKVTALDNPILMATPPPSERETSPASDRRPSTESVPGAERKNRRKQSHPGSSNPGSPAPAAPASISIRPHCDLFPPVATSTPRHKDRQETGAKDYSPAAKVPRSQSPAKSPVAAKLFTDEKENKDAIKNQLLQMQLGGLANLGGASPPPELLKALQYNPLLYYSYYAQMLTALQTQQKLLESAQTNLNNNNNNNSSSIKDILSPLKLANKEQQPNQEAARSSLLGGYYPSSNSPASSLSPIGYKDDEPRKRAPRALTGRYVRTGTAASPRVLQILRKKIEDRLKLKELLGENSHLYFGATKSNSPYKSHSKQKKKV